MGKINFAIQLWSGMPDYMALKFQKVLNSAARICIGSASNRYSTFKLLRSMGWLSFRQQAEYVSSQLINQIVKTSTPTLLYLKIKSDPIHPTRNNESIGNYPRHWNKMVSRTSFMYRGVKDYNTLPLNLRTEKNKIIFKKKLKVHIEKNKTYYINRKPSKNDDPQLLHQVDADIHDGTHKQDDADTHDGPNNHAAT